MCILHITHRRLFPYNPSVDTFFRGDKCRLKLNADGVVSYQSGLFFKTLFRVLTRIQQLLLLTAINIKLSNIYSPIGLETLFWFSY